MPSNGRPARLIGQEACESDTLSRCMPHVGRYLGLVSQQTAIPRGELRPPAMPVYEIVLQPSNGMRRVSHREHAPAEIGDVLTIDGNRWLVIGKEPPFEQRRIERLVCTPPRVSREEDGSRRRR